MSEQPVPTHQDRDVPRARRIDAVGFDPGSEPTRPLEACNLCGATRWAVLAHRDRYGFRVQTTACRRCGLAVLNPRMTAEAYTRFYRDTYRPLVSAFHGRRIDAYTIQEEQEEYARRMGDLLEPYLADRNGQSLLDVGGSTGVVAWSLGSRFGLRPTVLDPAPAELDEAESLGMEVVSGFVEDWDPGDRTFDVVGTFQTLDHLLDVSSVLEKLRSLVAEDGLLVADIVDFRAALLRGGSVESAVKVDHPFSLMEETAEAYLVRAGFEPFLKSYQDDRLHVAYVCRTAEPDPDALPDPDWVKAFFREIRFVQNARAPGEGSQ